MWAIYVGDLCGRFMRVIKGGDPRAFWLHFRNHDGSSSCQSCVGFIDGRVGRFVFHSSARRPRQGWSLHRQLGAGIKGLSARVLAVFFQLFQTRFAPSHICTMLGAWARVLRKQINLLAWRVDAMNRAFITRAGFDVLRLMRVHLQFHICRRGRQTHPRVHRASCRLPITKLGIEPLSAQCACRRFGRGHACPGSQFYCARSAR